MKLPVINAAEDPKKSEERQYLTSWKEIAEYMRCGVRTVQRYERDLGLPVRRPTGKSRGSVMATRIEIDAWVTAGPIRETFKLVRIARNPPTQAQAEKIENGLTEMRKLREQMRALRAETRASLQTLLDRVSTVHTLMPPARHSGYEPLTNMDMDIMDMDTDMDMDMHTRLPWEDGISSAKVGSAPSSRRRKSGARPRKQGFVSTIQKPN
jgi:hypothetical protein